MPGYFPDSTNRILGWTLSPRTIAHKDSRKGGLLEDESVLSLLQGIKTIIRN
jgi:hypothetical protein